jgi:hypothetical protein
VEVTRELVGLAMGQAAVKWNTMDEREAGIGAMRAGMEMESDMGRSSGQIGGGAWWETGVLM